MLEESALPAVTFEHLSHLASLDPRNHRQHLNRLSQQQHPAHKRGSSGSSITSVGPVSPYTPSFSDPRIVDFDSSTTSSPRPELFDSSGYSGAGAFAKPLVQASDSPLRQSFLGFSLDDYNLPTYYADEMIMAQSNTNHPSLEAARSSELSQPPGLSSRASYGSAYGTNEGERVQQHPIPKLDRTMTDVYQDELYHPTLATPMPSAHCGPAANSQLLSPQSAIFSARLQAANQGHLNARTGSPAGDKSRGRSPFRNSSKYKYADEEFSMTASTADSPTTRLNAAAAAPLSSEQQRTDTATATATREYDHLSGMPPDQDSSKTISPKEAMLDYNEAEDDAKMPLLPQGNLQKRENQFASTSSNTRQLSESDADGNGNGNGNPQQSHAHALAVGRRPRSSNLSLSSTTPSVSAAPNYHFLPASTPSTVQMPQQPQQYPFLSNSRRQSSSVRSASDNPDFPAQLSMDSTRSDNGQAELVRFNSDLEPVARSPSLPPNPATAATAVTARPPDTTAGSGSYTCVAAGCTQRFDTSGKLQKHRREAHRQPSPQQAPSPAAPSVASSASTPAHAPSAGGGSSTASNAPPATSSASPATTHRHNQNGPHRCLRINPTSGKPCDTQFSRSYDLTRHEETIHNNRKMKVRCRLCSEDKTFSRNDALTRHMRVVHPDVDFSGKSRRRGG